MTTELLLIAVVLWTVCGLGAYLITTQKGRADAGSAAVMGFVLGPIGLIAAARARTPTAEQLARVCARCGKVVDPGREQLCNHCGEPFAR